MCNEDHYRNAQLNAYLDGLIEDEPKAAPTIDPELEGCELDHGECQGDYAYECAECDRLLIVEDPYAPFEPAEHICQGGCYHQ